MNILALSCEDSKISKAIKVSLAGLAFAIIIGLSALVRIPIPGTPIPATLQTFALLTGAGLLSRFAAVQMIFWYLILGLVGAPFFAGGSGLNHILGPSGGYLIGFALASVIIGFFDNKKIRGPSRLLIYLCATIMIYPPGLIQLKYVTGADWNQVITMGLVPFVIFDVIKAISAFTCVSLARKIH